MLLEDVLRGEGSASPEMLSLVAQSTFFGDGATLKELLQKEEAVRSFLLGESSELATTKGEEEDDEGRAEEDQGEEEEMVRDLMSSDAFFSIPLEREEPRDGDAVQMLVLATKLMAHCADTRDLRECCPGALELLLPAILQEGCLAARGVLGEGRLARLASYLAASGMRVSPLWLPHLLPAASVAPTLEYFGKGDWQAPLPAGACGPFAVISACVAKKTFVSGHAPTLLQVTEQKSGAERLLVWKADDLRTDCGVTLMFGVFSRLWELGGVRVSSLAFQCTPLGAAVGVMEFVSDSVPLTDWDATAILRFSTQQLDTFLGSAAGSFTACFVLGCRDRHRDNLMVRGGETLWQLDFKHVFNRTTRGVDAPRYAVPRAVKEALAKRGAWEQFKLRCARAVVCLRRHVGLVTQLCRATFRGLAADGDVQRCVSDALFLGRSEAEVPAALSSYIEISVYSLKKYVKNQLHSANMKSMAGKSALDETRQ